MTQAIAQQPQQPQLIDWFHNSHSKEELANILYDYSVQVHGTGINPSGMERCTLARELDKLDETVKKMPAYRRRQLGFSY